MLAWLLLVPLAAAAPAGHYHPDNVARASAQFARAQEIAGNAFDDRQGHAQDLAAALVAFEEGLDLLGSRAPGDQRERLAALRKAFGRDRARLEAFAQDQLDRLDAAFSAALERALRGRELTVCRDAPAATGPRMQPGFARGGPAPACEGPSVDADLAAVMDRDPVLKGALDGQLAEAWPTIAADAVPVASVGTGTVALDVDALLRAGAGHGLRAIDDEDEVAREPFEAAIEQGASGGELRTLLERARAITARTAAARAALAAPVLAAVEAEAARQAKKGGPTVAWCAQPAALGGCTTPAATPAQVQALLDAPKVAAALAKADVTR